MKSITEEQLIDSPYIQEEQTHMKEHVEMIEQQNFQVFVPQMHENDYYKVNFIEDPIMILFSEDR